MKNEFVAIIKHQDKLFFAYSPEVPDLVGVGKTREQCLQSLARSIQFILEERRESGLQAAPAGSERSVVTVDSRRLVAGSGSKASVLKLRGDIS